MYFRDHAGYPRDTAFDPKTNYPDEESYKLFGAAVSVLSLPLEDVLEEFGVHFYHFVMCDPNYGWHNVINGMATDLHEFLESLSSMHFFINHVAFECENRGPSFKCEMKSDGTLRLHYYSLRKGLFPIARGLLREVATQLFNLDVKIFVAEHTQERRNNCITEHVVFVVESAKENQPLVKPKPSSILNTGVVSTEVFRPLDMSMKSFCALFPTHICFNKQLAVEHCGDFLYEELDLGKRRTTKLTDLFFLVQPDDVPLTFKGISTYVNSIYTFQFRLPLKRNNGCKKVPFALKGQMMLVNNGNYLLYMSSPYITTMRQLVECNLYLDDMQFYDSTRDIIMLNKTRISQQELKKKLDESTKEMQHIDEELDAKRAHHQLLVFGSLPPGVAELVGTYNIVTEAESFSEIACLQCDMPYYSLVSMQSSPQEIVSLISRLFQRFDRLVDMYNCYKMRLPTEHYFAVSGIPEDATINPAEVTFNLAIGMTAEARHVLVPKLNLPVLLRISIHCGSAVGGVIGCGARYRYCLFGETVNVSKRLNQYVAPGRILVTGAAKLCALRTDDNFVYNERGNLNIGHNQSISTSYLVRNMKRTVWDLIGKVKSDKSAGDGYQEVDTSDIALAYDLNAKALRKQKEVPSLAALATHNRKRLDRVAIKREKWSRSHTRSDWSKDAGYNRSLAGNKTVSIDSAACSIQ
ncbi:heme NO binding associated domain-containing protein [Ditylenchus destructor]|nr:heme NO binding associated domain-containing protein [Ditylenchus destructor]